MAKKVMTFEERCKRIMTTAATEYHRYTDSAMEYLAAIEGTSLDEQKKLFRMVLSVHGARKQTGHKCPTANSIKEKTFKAASRRVGGMVSSWARTALRNNQSLEVTADTIWDQLTLCEGKDRIVALGIFLAQPVVPYAKLPVDFALRPDYVYDEAHDRILPYIALLHRLENAEGVTFLEVAACLVGIIEKLEAREESVVLLSFFLRRSSHQHSGSGLSGALARLLGDRHGPIILSADMQPPPDFGESDGEAEEDEEE